MSESPVNEIPLAHTEKCVGPFPTPQDQLKRKLQELRILRAKYADMISLVDREIRETEEKIVLEKET